MLTFFFFFKFRFYCAGHGLQLPQEAAFQYMNKFIDQLHSSVVIAQCHFGIVFSMKSAVSAVCMRRAEVQRVCKAVKFYHGLGNYDVGYFTAERVYNAHKVIFFYINNVFL